LASFARDSLEEPEKESEKKGARRKKSKIAGGGLLFCAKQKRGTQNFDLGEKG